MGAWIETNPIYGKSTTVTVAPVWGRGLKLYSTQLFAPRETSPPYGGVD